MEENYIIKENGGYNIIEMQKIKFDLFEIPKISKKIDEEMKKLEYPSSIIDINKITFIDSTGFGFLITLKKNIEKFGNKSVIVCNVENILHVIEILNLHRFLKVFNSVDEALNFLNQN